MAQTKFIPQCKGISGTTRALAIDLTYQYDEVDIPIGALVLDIARINVAEDEFRDEVEQSERENFWGLRKHFSVHVYS